MKGSCHIFPRHSFRPSCKEALEGIRELGFPLGPWYLFNNDSIAMLAVYSSHRVKKHDRDSEDRYKTKSPNSLVTMVVDRPRQTAFRTQGFITFVWFDVHFNAVIFPLLFEACMCVRPTLDWVVAIQ